MPRTVPVAIALTAFALLIPSAVGAQSLGTFRWQLQPFCNAVVANVVQQGAIFTLDGYDDMCGAAQRAPLVGLATLNTDGTVAIGLTIVTSAGRGVQVGARISVPTLAGSWSDSAGNSGTFAFGASTGGSPRPAPASASTIPGAFALLTDGGFVSFHGQRHHGVCRQPVLGTRGRRHEHLLERRVDGRRRPTSQTST
jgi:hypothetical protein